MGRYVGLSINKGTGGGGGSVTTESFTRSTGITTDSSNNVTEVTLGNTKYSKVEYNNVGLITGFNETISGTKKGWILEYDSEGLVTSINERSAPHYDPSYTLTASNTTITENTTVTFNFTVTDTPDDTFYWRAEGTNITTADFSGGAVSGSVTTSGGSAQISLTTAEDTATEGDESFAMKIYNDSGYTILLASSPTVTISDTSVSAGLYAFTTYTFNEPDWGKDGTPFSTLQTRYAGEPFLTTGNLVQGAYVGYHKLTLPYTGVYEFEAAGAPGSKARNANYYGGKGIILKGRMSMNEGDIIQFVIGKSGEGDDGSYNGGGGGGTFIVKDAFFTTSPANSHIILVAGGGAGGAYDSIYNSNPQDAHEFTNGRDGQGGSSPGTGGTGGNGANGNNQGGNGGHAGPAAGIYSDGTNFNYYSNATIAKSFAGGATGGAGYYNRSDSPTSGSGHQSGFGGAGPGGNYAGGPGGGYSGGGGGSGNGYSSGGGGSFTSNLTNVSTVGYQGTGQVERGPGGYVKITFIG